MDERAAAMGERVRAFIRDGSRDDFDAVARAVFAYQYERIEPYRAFCRRRNASPESVTSWREIPAGPQAAFKHAELTALPARMTFRTSGTTARAGVRGAHPVADPELYRLSIETAFRRFVLPDLDRIRIFSLVPGLRMRRDSSLGFMSEHLIGAFGAEGSGTFVGTSRLLVGALMFSLDRAVAEDEPVLLLGTTIALDGFLTAAAGADRTWRLPAGSRTFDTGGPKGRNRTVEDRDLVSRIGAILGVPACACVNEYGMTEMLSQMYNDDLRAAVAAGGLAAATKVDRARMTAPHWVRTRVVDPATLHDAGEGVLSHVDLANCHSISAILTDDIGVSDGDGFRLVGRRAGAEARGCSIAMDQWLR